MQPQPPPGACPTARRPCSAKNATCSMLYAPCNDENPCVSINFNNKNVETISLRFLSKWFNLGHRNIPNVTFDKNVNVDLYNEIGDRIKTFNTKYTEHKIPELHPYELTTSDIEPNYSITPTNGNLTSNTAYILTSAIVNFQTQGSNNIGAVKAALEAYRDEDPFTPLTCFVVFSYDAITTDDRDRIVESILWQLPEEARNREIALLRNYSNITSGVRQIGSGPIYITYKGKRYRIRKGKRGGQYIVINKTVKKYLSSFA